MSKTTPNEHLNLLLVEDVDEMRFLLETVLHERLNEERLPVLSVMGMAASAQEAAQMRLKRRPDLVLLDEVLPGEASLDFMEELVSDGIRVLLLTGMEDPGHAVPKGALGRIMKVSAEARASERQSFRDAIRNAFLTDPPRGC